MMELEQTLPSGVAYKDRVAMKSADGFSYNRLYSTGADSPVWSRLNFDAGVRTTRSRALRPTPPEALFAQPARGHFAAREEHSGFVSNTSKVVFDKFTTFKTGRLQYEGDVPVQELQPIQLRRFKQKFNGDYFNAIRPDTETTNQARRMLGTYSTDFAHAKAAQTHIPNVCPGGPAAGSWYHPDVRLTQSAEFTRQRTMPGRYI